MQYAQTRNFRPPHVEEFDIPDNISEIEQAPSRQHKKALLPSRSHIFGGIHINYLLYIFIPILLLAPCYTYHVAVKTKEQRPYPHATITNTACYYPQDIVFRGVMLPASSFITLVYYVLYRWMAAEKKRTNYPGDIYAWMHPLAQASVLGFLAAIGTIDGAGYPNLHSIGAVFFFIVLFLISMVVTIVLRDMHQWDSTVLSRTSHFTKIMLAVSLFLIVIYCGVGALLQGEQNDDNIYLVILEWNLVFIGLLWLFTFKFDWPHVFVTLKGDISSSFRQVSI